MAPRRGKTAAALQQVDTNSTAMTPRRAEVKQLKDENEALRNEMASLTAMLERVKVQENEPTTQQPTAAASSSHVTVPTVQPPNFSLIKAPDAPVRPTSAYIYFCNAVRPTCKGMATTEQARILGAKWKEASEEQKAPYNELAAADRARYDGEMKKFKAQMEKVELEKSALTKMYESKKRDVAMQFYEQQLAANGGAPVQASQAMAVGTKPVREAPKKPRTAYNLFCAERRQALAKKNADGEKIDFGESMKMFSAEWAKLQTTKSGKKKLAKYNAMAAEEKDRYAREIGEYNELLEQDEKVWRQEMTKHLQAEKKEALKTFAPQVKAEAAAKAQEQLAKEQKKARKAQRDLEPKRPRSAYIMFCMAKREAVAASMPEASAAIVMAAMGRMWKEAPDAEKAIYEKESAADKERYNREMEQYMKKDKESS